MNVLGTRRPIAGHSRTNRRADKVVRVDQRRGGFTGAQGVRFWVADPESRIAGSSANLRSQEALGTASKVETVLRDSQVLCTEYYGVELVKKGLAHRSPGDGTEKALCR